MPRPTPTPIPQPRSPSPGLATGWGRRLPWAGLALLLAGGAGCRAVSPPVASPLSEATTLTLEASPLDNGVVALSGTTTLPDGTPLTAIALRHWTPEGAIVAGGAPLYSVLDSKPVTVNQGQWTTQLNLWQVADDGRYQEPWQAQANRLNLTPQPQPTVQFAITLAPHDLGTAMETAIAQTDQHQRLTGVLRMTPNGEPFLWADQSLPMDLPQGQTTPPTDRLARSNGGWGDRYLLVAEPPLPYTLTPKDQRQTTAPLRPQETLQ